MLTLLCHSSKIHTFLLVGCLLLIRPLAAQSPIDNHARQQQMLEMYQRYKSKTFPSIPDVSVEEYLALKKQEKIILLDVREFREQQVSIIPGAITKEEFEKDSVRYKNDMIVLYCTIGYRSGIYTRKLLKRNFQAVNLIGGVLAWAHAGQLFAGLDGETKKVHIYGKKWNLLPQGYEAVW